MVSSSGRENIGSSEVSPPEFDSGSPGFSGLTGLEDDQPERSEAHLQERLAVFAEPGVEGRGRRIELLTQIARMQGLQGKLDPRVRQSRAGAPPARRRS